MIAARKIAPFNFVLRRWFARIFRRRFYGVYVFGAEHLRALDPGSAVVGCVNHTNWWDGFVLYLLAWRFLRHDIYLAMEEKNLRRYRFFAWMGVFGVDLARPGSSLAGIRYALRLLKPGRLIWMFVQGRMFNARIPIEVRPGAVFLARHAGARLLPVVLRYEWLNEARPSVLVSVGLPLSAAGADADLAAVLNRLYTQLDDKVDSLDLRGAETLAAPRMSLNKRWDYLLHLLRLRRGAFDPQNR